MWTMKRLSEVSFQQALSVWNEGFAGYYNAVALTLPAYIGRMAAEGLSPEHSVIAFDGDRAVGCILNGIREIGGQKTAWNGGTAVIEDYRHQGVGRSMVEECLTIYRQESVKLATLEAISDNVKAISLYEKMGYQIADRLLILQHEGTLEPDAFAEQRSGSYTFLRGLAYDVISLPFYNSRAAWQTQWQSVRDGESLLILDSGKVVGYGLFKRVYQDSGQLTGIRLFQFEVEPERADAEEMIRQGLREIFEPLSQNCKRMTFNLLHSNEKVVQVLTQAGFSRAVEQVQMTRQMEGM